MVWVSTVLTSLITLKDQSLRNSFFSFGHFDGLDYQTDRVLPLKLMGDNEAIKQVIDRRESHLTI